MASTKMATDSRVDLYEYFLLTRDPFRGGPRLQGGSPSVAISFDERKLGDGTGNLPDYINWLPSYFEQWGSTVRSLKLGSLTSEFFDDFDIEPEHVSYTFQEILESCQNSVEEFELEDIQEDFFPSGNPFLMPRVVTVKLNTKDHGFGSENEDRVAAVASLIRSTPNVTALECSGTRNEALNKALMDSFCNNQSAWPKLTRFGRREIKWEVNYRRIHPSIRSGLQALPKALVHLNLDTVTDEETCNVVRGILVNSSSTLKVLMLQVQFFKGIKAGDNNRRLPFLPQLEEMVLYDCFAGPVSLGNARPGSMEVWVESNINIFLLGELMTNADELAAVVPKLRRFHFSTIPAEYEVRNDVLRVLVGGLRDNPRPINQITGLEVSGGADKALMEFLPLKFPNAKITTL